MVRFPCVAFTTTGSAHIRLLTETQGKGKEEGALRKASPPGRGLPGSLSGPSGRTLHPGTSWGRPVRLTPRYSLTAGSLSLIDHLPPLSREKKYLSYKGKANSNEESCQNLPSVPHARRVLCLPRCDGERTGRARQGPAGRDGPRRCRHRCDRVKRRRIPGLGRGRRPWRGPGAGRGGDLVF